MVKSGQIFSIAEVLEKGNVLDDEAVRTWGELVEHDPINCRAVIRDSQSHKDLHVDTIFLEPFAAAKNSKLMFIGEMIFEPNSLSLLRARTFACWNDLNLDIFVKALDIRRQFNSKSKQ